MKPALLIALFAIVALAGCTTSSIVVGNTRPETDPDTIKIYVVPPKRFDQIAIINADNMGAVSFTGQGAINASLRRAKKAAAEVGANGLLLTSVGDQSSGTAVSTGSFSNYGGYGTGISTSFAGRVKTVSAMAIWVYEE